MNTITINKINVENDYAFKFLINKGSVPTFLTWLGRPFHNFKLTLA